MKTETHARTITIHGTGPVEHHNSFELWEGGCLLACVVRPKEAYLFAAAPELLAALELALGYMDSPPFLALHGEMPANRARAAIAKAKGTP